MDPELVLPAFAGVLALLGARRRAATRANGGGPSAGQQVEAGTARVTDGGAAAVRWTGDTATNVVTGTTEFVTTTGLLATRSVMRFGGRLSTTAAAGALAGAGRLAGLGAGLVVDGAAAVGDGVAASPVGRLLPKRPASQAPPAQAGSQAKKKVAARP